MAGMNHAEMLPLAEWSSLPRPEHIGKQLRQTKEGEDEYTLMMYTYLES